MKTASLSGLQREGVGKKDASQLRASGRVPGVLYGGENQSQFHMREVDISKLVYNPDIFRISLEVGDKKYDTIIQEIQFHPVTDRVIHVDFLELSEDKPVRVDLPVRTTGTSAGVMNGGRMVRLYRRIPVLGLPGAIPEEVVIDITDLEIGDNSRVGDLTVEGFEVLLNDTVLLIAVKRTRVAMSEESEAAVEGAEGEAVEGEAAAEND